MVIYYGYDYVLHVMIICYYFIPRPRLTQTPGSHGSSHWACLLLVLCLYVLCVCVMWYVLCCLCVMCMLVCCLCSCVMCLFVIETQEATEAAVGPPRITRCMYTCFHHQEVISKTADATELAQTTSTHHPLGVPVYEFDIPG